MHASQTKDAYQVLPDIVSSDSEVDSCTEHFGGSLTDVFDKEKRQSLRERGFVVREGMWTARENKKLKENMKEFCRKYDIDEPRKLFFTDDCPDDREYLRNLIRKKKFYAKLRKGIPRVNYNVYIRARKMFDPTNYIGRFSDEEVWQIKRLQKTHGNAWSKIGPQIGRSARSVADRMKFEEFHHVGKWSKKEKRLLVRIVKEFSGFNENRDINKLYFGIPWVRVSKAMKTRTVLQCRMQWTQILSWAVVHYQGRHTQRVRWKTEDSVNLIKRIYKLDVNEEQDIDWMSLHQTFPNIQSPQNLAYHWYKLKVHHFHNHRLMDFEEILGKMHDSVLPALEKILKKRMAKDSGRTPVNSEFLADDDSESESGDDDEADDEADDEDDDEDDDDDDDEEDEKEMDDEGQGAKNITRHERSSGEAVESEQQSEVTTSYESRTERRNRKRKRKHQSERETENETQKRTIDGERNTSDESRTEKRKRKHKRKHQSSSECETDSETHKSIIDAVPATKSKPLSDLGTIAKEARKKRTKEKDHSGSEKHGKESLSKIKRTKERTRMLGERERKNETNHTISDSDAEESMQNNASRMIEATSSEKRKRKKKKRKQCADEIISPGSVTHKHQILEEENLIESQIPTEEVSSLEDHEKASRKKRRKKKRHDCDNREEQNSYSVRLDENENENDEE